MNAIRMLSSLFGQRLKIVSAIATTMTTELNDITVAKNNWIWNCSVFYYKNKYCKKAEEAKTYNWENGQIKCCQHIWMKNNLETDLLNLLGHIESSHIFYK